MDQRQTAIYYLDRRAYGRAEHHLRQWVLTRPDDVYAHMELIWCFCQRENFCAKWHDCNEFYHETYNLPNYNLLNLFVKAEQLFYDDRKEDAIDEYRVTINAGLDVPTVHHRVGIALKEIGRYEEAEKEFEAVLAVESHFLPTLIAYAEWLFDEGRFDWLESLVGKLDGIANDAFVLNFRDAKEDLVRLKSLKTAATELRKAVCLCNENKMRDALLFLWLVFRAYGENCSIIRTMAFLFYRNNLLHIWKLRFKDVLGEKGSFARYAEGLTLWYEDKYEEALKSYNEAMEHGLDHPLVRCGRALVLEKLERTEEEQNDLTRAYTRQPWLAYTRAELAYNAIQQSDFTTVVKLADVTAAERECAFAYDVSGYRNLATLERLALKALLKQGNVSEALSRVERDHSPIRDEDFLFTRAMVYAEADKLKRAAAELSVAIEVDESAIATADKDDIKRISLIIKHVPHSFQAEFAYALYPIYEDNPQEARTRLKKLSKKYPNNPRIWFHIANISVLLDDQRCVKDACRKAISCNPSCMDAVKLLCRQLKKDGNLQELLVLARQLQPETLPLEFALDLAKSRNDINQATDIASVILERNPENFAGVNHFLDITDDNSLEFAQMFERLLIPVPLIFESRLYIAWKFLNNGMPAESLKRYDALFADGLESINAILFYGISRMAIQDDC